MFQALIRIPENEYWNDKDSSLSEEILEAIKVTGSQFTDDPAWNTRSYEKYKIVNFVGNSSIERLQEFIEIFKLDWKILAANDGYKTIENVSVINTLLGYDPEILINYINRKRIYDKDGNFIKEEVPDKIEFGRFGGMPILEEKSNVF